MKKTFLVVPLLLAFAFVMAACQPAPQVNVEPVINPASAVPQLSVNGVGEVQATPDMATITIGVHTEKETASEALAENSEKTQAVLDIMKEIGIKDEDIKTSGISVYQAYNYDYNGMMEKRVNPRFVVDNSVSVIVRDLDVLPELLDKVVENGANNIYGISFDIADKTELIAQARKLAVENAQKQAKELAEAAGVELAKVISITSYESYAVPYPVAAENRAVYGADAGGGVPVSAGQMSVSVSVSMIYEIK